MPMLAEIGDQLFENYELFLRDSSHDLSTHSGKLELLSSDGAFRAYIDSLTEGLDAQRKRSFVGIAERQREMILEDVSMGPSSNVFGYAVQYFPILADIYTDPVISQIATTYPVDKSIITINRARIWANTKNLNGTTTTTRLPTTTTRVRIAPTDVVLTPGKYDLFAKLQSDLSNSALNNTNFNINKRYFHVSKITVESKYDAAGTNSTSTPIIVDTIMRVDSRGQISGIIEFEDTGKDLSITPGTTSPLYAKVSVNLIGNLNWDTGVIQFSGGFDIVNDQSTNVLRKTGLTSTVIGCYILTNITCSVMLSPRRGSLGRTEVSLKNEVWDINVDVTDDFEIKLDQERIQDYSDIYKIDLLKNLSTAIKHQILMNKDNDLSWLLHSHLPIYKENKSYQKYNISSFVVVGNNFTPSNVIDVFKGIIPLIARVNRNIRKIFRADPQYIVAGIKMATILESLQGFSTQFSSNNYGEAGFVDANASFGFRKQIILPCDSVADNFLYIVYKAPGDLLERTAIADIIYKPLYVIDEMDESQPRTFVKSRTALHITAPEAIGCIELIESPTMYSNPFNLDVNGVAVSTLQGTMDSLLGS